MGCLSSKLMISRSLSYRDVNFHRVANDSGNNDQLLALFNKLQNAGFDLPSVVSHDEEDRESIDASELMAGLDQVTTTTTTSLTRSKSCHLSSENGNGNDSPRESSLGMGVRSRSRSFHTVEDYDALLEKIRSSSIDSQQVTYLTETEQNHRDEDAGGGNTVVNDGVEKQVAVTSIEEQQKGWSKRKKVGKGLRGSLQLSPPTFSLNQLIDSPSRAGGGSNYVTPKFGTYNFPPTKRIPIRGDGDEERIDDFGDLVAAFEECMMQLQVEQDNLIKQIDEEAEASTHSVPQ